MEKETIESAQDFVCPDCGELVRVNGGKIVKDCRCGLPVFRSIKKQE